VVGRLSIPRLHIKSVVREGDSDGVLALTLGHIPGTALPGQTGNVGVAGHRDTIFRGLRDISPQDTIVLQTLDKRYEYKVENTRVVAPEDVAVLKGGSNSELTLVTCYPFHYIGAAPNRFIVRARLVNSDAPVEAGATKPGPAPLKATAIRPRKKPSPAAASERVTFHITAGSGRELVAGKVWFGLASADAVDHRVDGWLRIMPSRKTVWLRRKDVSKPITFSGDQGKFQLVVTRVTDDSVTGYVITDARGASE
jgi:LPXTG-site transpeptidase (sortase) family protein